MHSSSEILGVRSKDRFAKGIKTSMYYAVHFCLCSLFLILYSCRGEEVIYPTIGTHVTDEPGQGGLYILCEGNMGSNKARLDYMNLKTGDYYANWYGAQNPKQLKELGDVGNDIQVYGGRLYAVINCSHKVEVMDRNARHIGQVDIPNCRYLAFKGDKMYVSAYVGSIADPALLGSVYEVDTATLEICREVKVGHQPDELCVVDDRLYVCNSGGYLTNQYDSTVSVIDLGSFKEEKKIVVGLNPTRLRTDDHKQLWVCCQGNYKEMAPQVVILREGEIVHKMDIQCNNISIYGEAAGILSSEGLHLFSTTDFSKSKSLQLKGYEHPYGLLLTEGAIYITDAKNYVSSGVLHCYSYDGHEHWQAKTGDIPGHLCLTEGTYRLGPDTTGSDTTTGPSPYISRVYEYMPAPGQFVNELPKYEEGDNTESICRKCEAAIAKNARGMVSLGGWGGYITFGFDHPVENKEGADIQILGNAFRMNADEAYGSSEPGIVLVSCDKNGNGKPDDEWYELKGCLYDEAERYMKRYTRASDTAWNEFHQHPYYPQWIEAEQIEFRGKHLPSQTQLISGQYVQKILDYGYVDNRPNSEKEGSSFDISWAIDTDGQSVSLPTIDFVRVYTAIDEVLEQTGEISTEITGAIDLHIVE